MQELSALGGDSVQKKLVEDIKSFGRLPKQNKGTSEEAKAENKLAKQFADLKGSLPEHILQELGALGGGPQPADSAREELLESVRRLGFQRVRWGT